MVLYIQSCTHTHAHAHTYYTCTHVHPPTHPPTHAYAYTHNYTCMHTYMYIHTHIHTYIHTYTHASIHVRDTYTLHMAQRHDCYTNNSSGGGRSISSKRQVRGNFHNYKKRKPSGEHPSVLYILFNYSRGLP